MRSIRFWRISLHVLTALVLFVAPPSFPTENVVGPPVTLMLPAEAAWALSGVQPLHVLDYGSFVWLEIHERDLELVKEVAQPRKVFSQPFSLTLGEVLFDPLLSPSGLPADWQSEAGSGADLHLVQMSGPTRAQWLDQLEESGLRVVQYIHPHTYVVWGESSAVAGTARSAGVRWTGPFDLGFRVLPQWRDLPGDEIDMRALVYRGAERSRIIEGFEALGARVLGSRVINRTWESVGLQIAGSSLKDAAAVPGVYSIQPVPTDGGLRGEMSDQINVNNHGVDNMAFPGYETWLSSAGVDGAGVVIANVDRGVQESHPDLVSRFISCTGETCGGSTTSSHGTHTAGIMAADGSSGVADGGGFLRGLGVAPGAALVEQLDFPFYTQPGGMLLLMRDSAANGAVVSGNSWGPSNTPLGYDADTLQVDVGVRDADPNVAGNQSLTYVLSIMNGNGGISSQGTPDEAKNIFTIGSTKMQNSDLSQIVDINDLSFNTAHGPALDGRMIPHMVAPGCRVDSTVPIDTYGAYCGTSMASPQVSGGVALYIERRRQAGKSDPSPALVKAAFLAVAHDLVGNSDADGGVLGHPFDAKQGWGRMDLAAVIDPQVRVIAYDAPLVFDNTGEFWGLKTTVFNPSKPVRIMLVWTDAPGHGLGGSTPAWNNDLDLEVQQGDVTYLGNVFDPVDGWSSTGGAADWMNNTEGVFLGPTAEGSLQILIRAADVNSDGIPGEGDTTDQDFALVCYNCGSLTIFEDGFESGNFRAWSETVAE